MSLYLDAIVRNTLRGCIAPRVFVGILESEKNITFNMHKYK